MRNIAIFILAIVCVACTNKRICMENECIYGSHQTQFAFWSNAAEQMEVRLYNDAQTAEFETIALSKDAQDFWRATVKADLAGKFYTVRSFQNGQWYAESPGIFAKATNVNGTRAAILDMQATNPEGWQNDQRPAMKDPTDIVIYETHVRDFTMSPNSGVDHKGKFLGLAERVDYLVDLGISHLQILPFFDYGSIDETTLANNNYNWGYDPVNYNVPEGGYSSDPYDPATRIREVKQMIMALHKAGIRVVMDVVYNHTYNAEGCALGRVVPQYFYRMNEDGTYANGSGCGNETASDHEMMRRFMIESVCYWAREYHLDGFRFDLMGIHDQETMRQIRAALDEIDPSILTYGEGWAAMAPAYPYEELAMKQWTYKMPRVGAFSDDIRNALIGSPFDHERGFASGNPAGVKDVMRGLIACPEWSGEPAQHISYITCHDNYCLRDRIEVSATNETEETKLRMNKLAQTAVLVSQGTSFLYGGEEVYRTKRGIDNSYQSPDSINIIPWENRDRYADLHDYYQAMIAIRRAHKGFRLGCAEAVKEHVEFLDADNEQVIIYRIKDLEGIDDAKSLIVIMNGSENAVEAEIPDAQYAVLAHDAKANVQGLDKIKADHVTVEPYSATILAEE